MRTTVTLDDDVARAVDDLRRKEGLRTSEAINLLARRGLAAGLPARPKFVQTVSDMGKPLIDIDNTGVVLEFLDSERE